MAKYIFVYHGGSMPETEQERNAVFAAWQSWLDGMGEACIDGGNPVGLSNTVQSNGSVIENGGSNPISGYSIVQAEDQAQANSIAGGCPILSMGGSVEVAMIIEM